MTVRRRRRIRAAAKLIEAVVRIARDRGLLLYSGTGNANGTDGDLVVLGPPFVVTDDELARIADGLGDALDVALAELATARDLRRGPGFGPPGGPIVATGAPAAGGSEAPEGSGAAPRALGRRGASAGPADPRLGRQRPGQPPATGLRPPGAPAARGSGRPGDHSSPTDDGLSARRDSNGRSGADPGRLVSPGGRCIDRGR